MDRKISAGSPGGGHPRSADKAIALARFRRSAESASVASFDLFDTLVRRNFLRPHDLFSALGDRLSKDDPTFGAWFAANRACAEEDARRESARRGAEEVTLADIYRALASRLSRGAGPSDFASVMALEAEMELATVSADPDVLSVFAALARAGKRVIIVSDMYLTREVIEAALRRCGIDGHERLYLSSETGLTKRSGAVWARVRGEPPSAPTSLACRGRLETISPGNLGPIVSRG